jgi:transcriptional regulator of arginine metabolism
MSKKATSSKEGLIIALQTLLQSNAVGTQQEIREALQKKGFTVNQVKISRLLHKLGAIKMNEGGLTVYRLPKELVSITSNRSLKHLVSNITHNESLIIIQTAPGSAQLVAKFIDQNKDIGILGTVAGDDTIFIAPKVTKKIKNVFQEIYRLFT